MTAVLVPQSQFDQQRILASTATSQDLRQTASGKGVHGRRRQLMGTRMTRSDMTVVLCRKLTVKYPNKCPAWHRHSDSDPARLPFPSSDWASTPFRGWSTHVFKSATFASTFQRLLLVGRDCDQHEMAVSTEQAAARAGRMSASIM